MKIKRNWLTVLSIAYIYIPTFLFLFEWTRLLFAVVTITVCVFCFYRFWKEESNSQGKFSVDLVVLIFAVILFIWIGYYAGYGRFVDQAGDWKKHNAILYDLVKRGWPVLYANNGERSMLTYYLGQYIVPAVMGKMFHSTDIAEITLYVWNVIGLILVFLNVLVFTKVRTFLKQLTYALMIPFFSVPLWLSELFLKRLSNFNTLGECQWFYTADGILLQYSNNYTLLKWVFPQTIPIWLIVLVFLINKEKIRHYVFILLPTLFFGTLTFIGIFPIAVAAALQRIFETKKIKEGMRQIFSIENILMGLTLGLVLFFYFLGNVTGEKPEEIGFGLMPYTKDTIVIYFSFILINILPYALILLHQHRSDWIFYVCIFTLVVLPLFRMGKSNDLTMRASIPALFLLMLYIVQNLYTRIEDTDALRTVRSRLSVLVIFVFLLVGMYYPFNENSAIKFH